MAPNQVDSRGKRLDTWKEIGAFLGRDERTAKRWEKERGLPVHRVPGVGRANVFAYTDELSRWLHGGGEPAAANVIPETVEDRPVVARPSRPARVRQTLVLVCLILAVAGVLVTAWVARRAALAKTRHQVDKQAEELYLNGIYFWHKRTPESLRQALELFTRAIVRDPGFAQAYVGVANCYNLLREYSDMPPAEAYPRAIAAARRAIALDDSLSGAHSSLAFAEFFWEWNPAAAEREYRRAIELDPRSVPAHHWYATSLMNLGRFPEALEQIEIARGLDPASTAILADKGFILFSAGRRAEAVALLKQIETSEPEFLSPHNYLSYIYLAGGDIAAYLVETRRAAELRHDAERLAIVEAAARGFSESGRAGFLHALMAAQKAAFAAGGTAHAYELAETSALEGDKRAAIGYLNLAWSRHEAGMIAVANDFCFTSLRGEPAFRSLVARMGERLS
jgi:tetratricopeptide (TPR) repeat protein